MAGTKVDIGTGASLLFADTGFNPEILGADHSGISRPSIDTSNLATAAPSSPNIANATFIPGRITDAGELAIEVHFDPDIEPPVDQPIEVITLTFPKVPADATAAKWVFSGFATSFVYGISLDEKSVGTLTIKLTGSIAITAAA